MFPYRVKYTVSESNIKIYNFFYNNTNNTKILSICGKMFEQSENSNKNNSFFFLFCSIYRLYNSHFVFFGKFVNFVILGFWDSWIFIFIYTYTCRSLYVCAAARSVLRSPPAALSHCPALPLLPLPRFIFVYWCAYPPSRRASRRTHARVQRAEREQQT